MSLAPEPFAPGENYSRLDVTAVTANVALPGGAGNTLYVFNAGPNLAALKVGLGAQTATTPGVSGTITAGFIVPPLQTVTIRVRFDADNLAAICLAAQTAQLWISRGSGLKA